MNMLDVMSKLPVGVTKGLASLANLLPEKTQQKLAGSIINAELKSKAKLKVRGLENLDAVENPCIFISNHLSNLDGVVLSRLLKKKFDPYFVAGVKLNEDPFTNFFKKLVRTIEIHPNTADLDSIKTIIHTLKDGESIAMFPEGTRSRDRRMIEAKKGITLIARLSKAPIVPIALMGTEIVAPIDESGQMSRERVRQGVVEVVIGQPFALAEKKPGEDKQAYEERALKDLMNHIAVNLREEYRGFYDGKLEGQEPLESVASEIASGWPE